MYSASTATQIYIIFWRVFVGKRSSHHCFDQWHQMAEFIGQKDIFMHVLELEALSLAKPHGQIPSLYPNLHKISSRSISECFRTCVTRKSP